MKFNGPRNTGELIACVEELFRNQPFKGRILDVVGRPDEFCTSVEFMINDLCELGCFIGHYTSNNGETLRIAKAQKIPRMHDKSIWSSLGVNNPFQYFVQTYIYTIYQPTHKMIKIKQKLI